MSSTTPRETSGALPKWDGIQDADQTSIIKPHIFSEPRGPPGFGSAIRYPLSALAARRRPRSRHYSPPTYCAIARSPPWARGYHNHRSPVPPLGTSNGTVDACMIQSKMLRSISLGSGRAVTACARRSTDWGLRVSNPTSTQRAMVLRVVSSTSSYTSLNQRFTRYRTCRIILVQYGTAVAGCLLNCTDCQLT